MKRFLKIAGCVIAAAAALGILAAIALLAAFFWWWHSLEEEITAKITLTRAEGYPANAAELDAFYKEPPPGENAAELYQKAFDALKLDGFDDSKLPFLGDFEMVPGEAIPKDVLAEMDKCLKANAEALAFADEAMKKTGCRFPVNLNNGLECELPHLNKLRNFSRLLAISSVASASKGDSKHATKTLLDIVSASRAASNEPLLISSLVGAACLGIFTSSSAFAANACELDAASIKSIQEKCAAEESGFSFKYAIAGERAMVTSSLLERFRATLANSAEMKEDDPGIALAADAMDSTGIKDLNISKMLDIFHELTLAAECKNTHEEMRRMQMAKEQVDRLSPIYIICRIQLPGMSSIGKKHGQLVARLSTARTALAVELFRREEGRLPESLAELVPKYIDAVPEDPFDGKPLKYRKGLLNCGSKNLKTGKWKPGSGFDPFASKDDLKIEKHGFVVYSVGLDGKDDKAEDCCDFLSSKQKDICFPVFEKSQAPESRIPLP